jgi:hypothetical protein
MRRSLSRVIALVLAAGVVLSACSSTDRSAAPPEVDIAAERVAESTKDVGSEPGSDVDVLDVDETSPDLEGTQEEERVGGGLRGSRVCVINARSSDQVHTPRINVQFTKADRVSTETELVAPGGQRCGEAAYSITAPQDVEGDIYIMYIDAPVKSFYARNPLIGLPAVEVRPQGSSLKCAVSSDEEDKRVYDNGVVRYTTLQLADSSQYKEFTITVSDSAGVQGFCDIDLY